MHVFWKECRTSAKPRPVPKIAAVNLCQITAKHFPSFSVYIADCDTERKGRERHGAHPNGGRPQGAHSLSHEVPARGAALTRTTLRTALRPLAAYAHVGPTDTSHQQQTVDSGVRLVHLGHAQRPILGHRISHQDFWAKQDFEVSMGVRIRWTHW